MIYALLYVMVLLPLGMAEAIWLNTMGRRLYRPVLGDILLESPRIAPAIVFYLIYPAGLVIFAALPAIAAGSVTLAILYAALFGAFTYATYDLTNFATLRNWTLQLTVIDVCWGSVLSAFASAVGYCAATAIGGWLGSGA